MNGNNHVFKNVEEDTYVQAFDLSELSTIIKKAEDIAEEKDTVVDYSELPEWIQDLLEDDCLTFTDDEPGVFIEDISPYDDTIFIDDSDIKKYYVVCDIVDDTCDDSTIRIIPAQDFMSKFLFIS